MGQETKKVALVTGAYRGIGLEVVKELAAKGWRVFLSARKRDAAEKAIRELTAQGYSVEFLAMDVASPVSIQKASKELAQSVDHLDVLINNAGILGNSNQSVLEVSADEAVEVLRTNAIGPLLTAQAFLPLLKKSSSGRIINVSSGAGSLSKSSGWAPAYSISKTALNAVTRQLYHALKELNIPVNSVCPGWVRTEMGGKEAPRSVEQGADTIVWLADEAPASLTGQFLRDRQPIPW